MNTTRKIGLGLALGFGLMLTVPVLAGGTPGQATKTKQAQKPTKTAMKPVEAKTMAMAPMMSGPDPCIKTLEDVRAAQATVAQLKALGDEIKARHASLAAGVTTSADAGAPYKCPACGMMMPTTATGNLTKAVKYGGKTYFCCKGCDMSATADKE